VPRTGRLSSAELWEAVATSKPLMIQDVEPLLKLIPREVGRDKGVGVLVRQGGPCRLFLWSSSCVNPSLAVV
jgi:hypothetical protein